MKMNKRNILVLGAEGFIGAHVCAYLQAEGMAVTGCDIVENRNGLRDFVLLDSAKPDYNSLFQQGNYDVCINAAGRGNVSFSVEHPTQDFKDNVSAVADILNAIRNSNKGCKYLHISSAAVYGNPEQLPIAEDAALQPVSPYGFHKRMSEMVCREYYELYQVPIVILRPFSVFGNGLKKQLFWDTCEKLKASEKINLFGTGDETRDFIHIDDLSRLILLIMRKSSFKLDIFNAATGTEETIKNIASLFVKHFPGNKEIKFSGEIKEGDPLNWRADISRIKEMGFVATRNFEDAVKEYIHHYLNLYSN